METTDSIPALLTGGDLLPGSDNESHAIPDDASVAGEGADEPKRGTLAWLQAQPTVTLADGTTVPACHRIPAGAELAPPQGIEDKRCRVLKQSGERCKGVRLQAYGLCMGHSGGGGTVDLDSMRLKAASKKREMKIVRQIVGIGPSRQADPRAVMRVRAAQRAFDIARAVVDGPLDDRKLGVMDRQRAALAALDATFPLQTATLSLEIGDPEGMSWNDMEQAISLLG